MVLFSTFSPESGALLSMSVLVSVPSSLPICLRMLPYLCSCLLLVSMLSRSLCRLTFVSTLGLDCKFFGFCHPLIITMPGCSALSHT
ncbi:hypothetical protein BDV98DRAFT_574398 [Pterulicium gracile]|uniref:Uncharacterized protein n=1 Tax=Pterulicium gracile TaxID=1884261 RepID=A0A5C3Q5N0_9AGAR|nr:hypothetical protein BDV98DRAFT_574398 [Pterula gracilis]